MLWESRYWYWHSNTAYLLLKATFNVSDKKIIISLSMTKEINSKKQTNLNEIFISDMVVSSYRQVLTINKKRNAIINEILHEYLQTQLDLEQLR